MNEQAALIANVLEPREVEVYPSMLDPIKARVFELEKECTQLRIIVEGLCQRIAQLTGDGK